MTPEHQKLIEDVMGLPDEIEVWMDKDGRGHLTDIEGSDLKAALTEILAERDRYRVDVEAYKEMFNDVDIIQFGNGAITVCGSAQNCWDVLNNQGETKSHESSVLNAYAALKEEQK